MKVLGIDAGLTCGFALYDADGTRSAGILDLREHGEDIGAQLSAFEQWLATTVQARRVGLVAMERPFGRAFTVVTPSVIVAVAHMCCHNMGIPRREFTASQIKHAMTGNGRAAKEAVQEAVETRYGFDLSHIRKADQNDAADAAAVAVLAWAREQQA